MKVAGATAGRLVGEVNPPTGKVNLVQYAVTGERSYATLTFSTTPAKLSHYEPIFEAAAQATRGVVDTDAQESEKIGMLTGAIAGGIGGAIGGLYIRRSRRKRQAAPAATPPAPGSS